MTTPSLPRRTAIELARALRMRADHLHGADWEAPATIAMMRDAADILDELQKAEQMWLRASLFIRDVMEAVAIEQPPEGATISLDQLRLQVIGYIEELKLEENRWRVAVAAERADRDHIEEAVQALDALVERIEKA